MRKNIRKYTFQHSNSVIFFLPFFLLPTWAQNKSSANLIQTDNTLFFSFRITFMFHRFTVIVDVRALDRFSDGFAKDIFMWYWHFSMRQSQIEFFCRCRTILPFIFSLKNIFPFFFFTKINAKISFSFKIREKGKFVASSSIASLHNFIRVRSKYNWIEYRSIIIIITVSRIAISSIKMDVICGCCYQCTSLQWRRFQKRDKNKYVFKRPFCLWWKFCMHGKEMQEIQEIQEVRVKQNPVNHASEFI